MKYAELTTRDPNPIKRWIQRRRFSDAIREIGDASHVEALRILDFGAGNGELVRQLLRIGAFNAWVYEPTPALMVEAKENLAGCDSVSFIDTVSALESSTFDYVFCLEVMEHLPESEINSALAQIHRVLKPDGVAVIGVPHELFLPALAKGIFRMARRLGDFDADPKNIVGAAMGRPPSRRPTLEIAVGFRYHVHHLGFDYRALEENLLRQFEIRKRWFSPLPVLGAIFNSEVYFSLRKQLGMGTVNNIVKESEYEKNQRFNALVARVHGTRYKVLLDVFTALAATDKNTVIRVVDIGCAHAKTFALLNDKFNIDYVGIELDPSVAQIARERYGSCANFSVIADTVENHFSRFDGADAILALESLEHIPEHIVVRIIERIALAKPMAFMCSVPNEVGPVVWIKNIGSFLMRYMRHQEYRWSETFYAGVYNLDKVEVHGTGHKGFDWRWLAQTIRHNMAITKTYSNPILWLPRTTSLSIIFVCLRRDRALQPVSGPTP